MKAYNNAQFDDIYCQFQRTINIEQYLISGSFIEQDFFKIFLFDQGDDDRQIQMYENIKAYNELSALNSLKSVGVSAS